jgi:hypothetical protein
MEVRHNNGIEKTRAWAIQLLRTLVQVASLRQQARRRTYIGEVRQSDDLRLQGLLVRANSTHRDGGKASSCSSTWLPQRDNPAVQDILDMANLRYPRFQGW